MVKIGFNVHPTMTAYVNNKPQGTRQYSADEKAYLRNTLRAVDASANLFLSDTDMMLQYARELPNSLAVMRFYHDHEGDFYNLSPPPGKSMAKHLFDAYSPWYKYPNVVINLGNESSSYVSDNELDRQDLFYAEAAEVFGIAGVPLAIPGWGTGHPDVLRLGKFSRLWEQLKRFSNLHYLATHEYFSYRGTDIGNGRVGRHEVLAEWLDDHYGFIPNMLLTEHGSDDIDGSYRGWLSWPADPGREARYFSWLQECRRRSYNRKWIKGVMIYSWGDSNGWPDFDVSKATQLHGWLATENHTEIWEAPPTVPEEPKPPVVVDRAPALSAEIKAVLDKYK